MDLVLKLRELRRLRRLTQKDVARLSGIGVKTISSFETGDRIGSLKVAQLERLLAVYGVTQTEFFGRAVEKDLAPWELTEEEVAARRLVEKKFQVMVEAVAAVYGDHDTSRLAPEPGVFKQELSRSGSRY